MRLSSSSVDDLQHWKSLKEIFKVTKIFYKDGQRKTDHEKVLKKATECTNQILEAEKAIFLI